MAEPPDSPQDQLDDFGARERQAWDSSADAWRRWWPKFEAGAQGLTDRLVELAGLAVGSRVLDLGTGVGEPALTAARRVTTSGRVVATDLAPRMLDVARDRLGAAGITNVELVVADAHVHELPPGSFHAALCRWGLMLMQDPVAVARRVREALRPGARFAAAVWGESEEVPFLSITRKVLQRELRLRPPPTGRPGPFALGAPGALDQVLVEAGFDEVLAENVSVAFSFVSPAEYARFALEVPSTARRLMESVPEHVRQRVRAAVEAAADPWQVAGGGVEVVNLARCAVGCRPI